MSARDYMRFWHDVGRDFPDLGGAPSTRYYRHNEERLLTGHLPSLAGIRLLKTDLWDEAKNTRILHWAWQQGASVFGVDISEPVVRAARRAFPPGACRAALGDVRQLPFADASFDAVYSMGTVEHFAATGAALSEIHRVLRPGGRAIIGVPNRHDPFLRPLLVTLLSSIGLYGYGYEKSYSRATFGRMLREAGFDVLEETGILFMPGWLRMADLAAHAWCTPATRLTGALVGLCAAVDRRWRGARRHGYLLATVCTRAAMPGPGPCRAGAARGTTTP